MQELSICYSEFEAGALASVKLELRSDDTPSAVTAEGPFDFHLHLDEAQNLRWYLEDYPSCPWGAYQDRAITAEASIRKIGERLFRAAFKTEEQRDIYAKVADQLDSTSIAIAERSRASSVIPWELMQDPARRETGALSRLSRRFYRTELSLPRVAATRIDGPVNVLMVIARPRGPTFDVPFHSVARPLIELFGREELKSRIRLTVLDPPTFSNLSETLSQRPGQYHIVHFDGHGGYPTIPEDITGGILDSLQRQLQGCLVFEGESGSQRKDRQVTGSRFGAAMTKGKVPVVLLNACQSGMADRSSLFPSIGHQVLKAGVSGVVAMSYSVLVQSAASFMYRVYETMLNGGELGYAVRQGREELACDPTRTLSVAKVRLQDWVVPVLLQNGPVVLAPTADRRLTPPVSSKEKGRTGFEVNCPPAPKHGLIGRDGVILELERAFRRESVVWLKGMSGVGKTEVAVGFARWLVASGRLNGSTVRVPIDFETNFDGVARQIATALSHSTGQSGEDSLESEDAAPGFATLVSFLRENAHFIIIDDTRANFVDPAGDSASQATAHEHGLKAFTLALLGGKTKVLVVSAQDEPGWLIDKVEVVRLTGLRRPDAVLLAERCLEARDAGVASAATADDYQELLAELRGNPRTIIDTLQLTADHDPKTLRSLFAGWEDLELPTSLLTTRHGSLFAPADDLRRSTTFASFAADAFPYLALFRGIVAADVLGIISRMPEVPPSMRDMPPNVWNDFLRLLGQLGWLSEVTPGFHEIHPEFAVVAVDRFPSTSKNRAAAKAFFIKALAALGHTVERMYRQDTRQATTVLTLLEDNLLAALRHAVACTDWDSISGLLAGVQRLYRGQSRWPEWASILSGVRTAIASHPDPDSAARIELLNEVRSFAAELIRHGLYREEDQAETPTSFTGPAHEATTRYAEGIVALEQRRLDDAERAFRRALEIAESDGDGPAAAQPAQNLGNIGILRGQLDEARFWFEKALALVKDVPGARLQPLYQMAILSIQERNFAQAETYLTECRGLAALAGDVHIQAHIELQLGVIAFQNELEKTAEGYFRRGLALAERANDLRAQAGARMQLAFVVMRLGRFEEAETWARQVVADAEKLKDTDLARMARETLDELVVAKKNPWYQAGLGSDSNG